VCVCVRGPAPAVLLRPCCPHTCSTVASPSAPLCGPRCCRRSKLGQLPPRRRQPTSGSPRERWGELLVRSGPSTELCSPNWCHDALCVWDRRRSLLSSAVALSVATPSSPTRSCTWARSSVGRAACFAPCGPCTSFMSVASRARRVATRTSHVRSWLSVTATQTGRRWRTLSSRTCNVPTCSRCVYVRVYVRIPLIMLVACTDT
jgi:hypothetical protein